MFKNQETAQTIYDIVQKSTADIISTVPIAKADLSADEFEEYNTAINDVVAIFMQDIMLPIADSYPEIQPTSKPFISKK